MKSNPIPTSARLPVPYTPLHMDADRLERDGRKRIDELTREASVLRLRARDGRADAEGLDPELAPQVHEAERQVVLAREGLEIDIASVRSKYPQPIVFSIKVPTSLERDAINARLISLGLSPVSQQFMRSTMIEELFDMDWGKGSKEANEEEAEELANFLDGCWQRQEVHDAAISQWESQERERILDEAAGAPKTERAPLPPKVITVRELAKMHILVDRVMSERQRMHQIAAKANDFNRVNSILLVRIHVVGARRGDEVIPIEWDPVLDVMTEASLKELREQLDDATWLDLISHVNSLYVLDEYERGNSDSQPEKLPDQSGSPELSADTATSGGSSTTSSTAPAPSEGSATIIELSSASTSVTAPVLASATASDSPTVEA